MRLRSFLVICVLLFLHGCKKPGEKNGTNDGTASDGNLDVADAASIKTEGDGYISYFSGSATNVSPETKSSILLVGGGTDRDDAMQWFVDRAGKGDIVVIRPSGADGYNKFLLAKGANSVRSIVVTSEEGGAQKEVLDAVNAAEGIFFAGGDQSFYVKFLKKTKLIAIK